MFQFLNRLYKNSPEEFVSTTTAVKMASMEGRMLEELYEVYAVGFNRGWTIGFRDGAVTVPRKVGMN
jgi:hypothetical protein